MVKSLKLICVSLGMVFIPFLANAQLSIDECQRLAMENYPLIKRYDIVARTTSYSIKNINKGYLPQITFTGQANYQSEVNKLPSLLADMIKNGGYNYKGLSKDQYKLALDMNQTIWDGGDLEAQKRVTELNGKVQGLQIDVDMYAIRNHVNELFFGILLISDKLRLNSDMQILLDANCRKVENMHTNGTAMKADVDAIRAEYLTTKQQMTQLKSMKKNYQQMLAIYIGRSVDELIKPEVSMPSSMENRRPELQLFNSQILKNETQKEVLDAAIRPKLSLFAQGYYGYPGYNMFDDMFEHKWRMNGIVGLRLSYNIGRLYTHKNDKKKLDLMCDRIETSQDVFLFNNNLQTTQYMIEIEQYSKMMAEDNDIIALRASVREAAESKLQHGIIDVNDLLQEINRENKARTERSSHELEMLKSIYELKNTINQ